MNLKALEQSLRADVFDNVPDAQIVSQTDCWQYKTGVPINAPIAMGWFENDNILILNSDGVFIFDIQQNQFSHKDFDSTSHQNISGDNLTYAIFPGSERISIFGLRGGGGIKLTKDNRWVLDICYLSWNVRVPRLINTKTNEYYYFDLKRNDFEGYIFVGISNSENYFAIMGDGGIDIYSKVGIGT